MPQLFGATLFRRLVGASSQKACAVAEAPAGDLIVADLDYQFRAK